MNEIGKTELVKLLQDQLPATRGNDGAGVTMLAHAGRCVLGNPTPEPDSNQAGLDTLDRMAAALPDVDAAARLLTDALRLPVVRSSDEWRNQPDPDPVIWRDHAQFADAVLSSGEVAVLSGAGKSGKSYIALTLAVAAAQDEAKGRGYGEACGLRVAALPVVVLSYEDAPKRIDQRVAALDTGASVRLIPDPPRLFHVDSTSRQWGRSEAWPLVWAAIREVDPGLVVIDTGPKAMGGETNDGGAVIAFLQALEGEARSGGFGVLLTAHDTKAHRNQVKAGEAPDAGAIAGSGQWHDSPRGVLYLSKHGPGDAPRILEAVKCSYGRDGWGASLVPDYRDHEYRGLCLNQNLDREQVAAKRSEFEAARKNPEATGGGNHRKRTDGKAAVAEGGTNETQGFRDGAPPLY